MEADCVTDAMESIIEMYARRSAFIFSSSPSSPSRVFSESTPMPENMEVKVDSSSTMVATNILFISSLMKV